MVRCVSMTGMYGRGRVAPAFASEFMGVSGGETIFGYANTGYQPVREEGAEDVEKKREANRRKQKAFRERQKAKERKRG